MIHCIRWVLFLTGSLADRARKFLNPLSTLRRTRLVNSGACHRPGCKSYAIALSAGLTIVGLCYKGYPSDVILLYWDIGRAIVKKQEQFGWGEAVVETVAADLQREFPASMSFSSDNLWRMRQMYLAYSSPDFLGQVVPDTSATHSSSTEQRLVLDLLTAVPWGQNLLIIKKVADPPGSITSGPRRSLVGQGASSSTR